MIEVKNLTKFYGDRAAIKKVSFEIKKGELVGFLGPNGAGKTTTMKILTGFMSPSQGEVKIAGIDIFEDPIGAKSKIGYLPETPPIYPEMKVESYLKYVAQLRSVPAAELKEAVDYALEKLDLTEVRKRVVGHLSKGFRQRVGVAQALVSKPEILVLDEPTVGLDPNQVFHFRELLAELKGKHTIILSTHILSEVQASCEKVIIINQGEVVASDSLNTLIDRSKGADVTRVVLRFKRSKEIFFKELESLDYVKMLEAAGDKLHIDLSGGEDSLENLSSRVVEAGVGLLEMKVEGSRLEDVFLELTRSSQQNNVEQRS